MNRRTALRIDAGSGTNRFSLDNRSYQAITQVGPVTLIGVISKQGILIVEFANKLQQERGVSRRQAIELATSIRLRPVLMTTAALVPAVVPLLIATGQLRARPRLNTPCRRYN